MTIEAAVGAAAGSCPRCRSDSARVHSRYWRQLTDMSIAGRVVVLRLRVRRFFCPNIGCAAGLLLSRLLG
ncbi:transposase family protein [Nocardia sp. NPDC051911]|uniref:transposase family protein n=1 Tax=Nocardia sp. NPDC051911 TaxID=3154648 RepID=UPI003427BB87